MPTTRTWLGLGLGLGLGFGFGLGLTRLTLTLTLTRTLTLTLALTRTIEPYSRSRILSMLPATSPSGPPVSLTWLGLGSGSGC